jgi:DNA-binding CsgD family transcriptional regulator
MRNEDKEKIRKKFKEREEAIATRRYFTNTLFSGKFAILSNRERDILPLIAEGMTNQEIGDALGIKLPTVISHVQRMTHKLGKRNRVEIAVMYAREEALDLAGRQRDFWDL